MNKMAIVRASMVASLPFLAAIFLISTALDSRIAVAQVADHVDSEWIRPHQPGDALIWGRKDGIVFGIPSPEGLPGPRGLIRVGIISAKTGKPELLNFIAIEPVVFGPGSRDSRQAFSELEQSRMDPGSRGKRLWVDLSRTASGDGFRGDLQTFSNRDSPIERLTVRIDVERFTANGAHVYLMASIDSDHPHELRLEVHQYDDSPDVEELTLTATMGNYERLRWLWLKHRVVDSRKLYASYAGDAFTEHENYPLDAMLRTSDGDAIALCTSNESSPSKAANPAAPGHWRYRLPKLTQYWKVPAHDIEPDLRVRVNGRRVYWASRDTVPGGVAFENFEVRQRYKPGQVFIFGVTAKEPWEFEPPIPEVVHFESARPSATGMVEK